MQKGNRGKCTKSSKTSSLIQVQAVGHTQNSSENQADKTGREQAKSKVE